MKSIPQNSTVTITRKVHILINEPDAEKRKEKTKQLYDLRYNCFLAANTIVNYHYSLYQQMRKETAGLPKEDIKQWVADNLGTSVENHTYQMTGENFPMLPSIVRSSLNRKIYGNFKNTLGDVLKGRRTLPNYKLGMPVPFMTSDLRVKEIDGKKEFVYLFQKDIEFILDFGRDRSNNRLMAERILSGEYKLCDSSFSIEEGKLYFLMAIKMDVQRVALDPNKIAATNLGMICPLYVATNTGQHQGLGSVDEFLKVRIQMQKRRRRMQANMTTVKSGKGRNRKLKGLDHLREVERNFARTYNHKLSKALVMYCVNNGIGTIKTEDLLGGSKTLEKTFILRNWSFFELQSQIQYKAKMYGINIVKVATKDITRKCFLCGHVDEEAVDLDKREYHCTNPDCKSHKMNKRELAYYNIDYNAANNVLIAEPAPKKEKESEAQPA